jgi:iron complex transport system substrate-binding protein
VRRLIVLFVLAAALAAQPRRIVSTSPSITEILFALGLGDRVVAVSQYCHYPPEAERLPRVGGYVKPDIESIVALRPDLVILQSKAAESAGQYSRMKLDVLRVEDGDLATMFRGFRSIAARCGVPERGARLESEIRARLDAIRQRTAALPRRSLVFIVGRAPGRLENLIAVGKGSFLNELIEIAGGRNALAENLMPYPKISLEALFGLNPDVLVDMGEMSQTVGVTAEQKRKVVELWGTQPTLKAVTQKRVYAIAADIFVVPGPRVGEAAEAFERMLHPERSPKVPAR